MMVQRNDDFANDAVERYDREAEHSSACEGMPLHTWDECPFFGWDELGMYERD